MMFIILSYDICEKRVGKASKIAKKYLTPKHRSVYQGYITDSKLLKLKRELEKLINPEEDSVIIYKMESILDFQIEQIGEHKNSLCDII